VEIKYFSLGTSENNSFVKLIRIVFGVVCFAVAIFWLVVNIKSLKADLSLWITIIFLAGFGFYQIWSGLGRATRFIEIGDGNIRLKKNPVFSPIDIPAAEMEKIELFPLSVIFFLKTKKRILLRFGTTYYETNEKIKDEIIRFSETNNILLEYVEDKI
jgi:hypothetical protein